MVFQVASTISLSFIVLASSLLPGRSLAQVDASEGVMLKAIDSSMTTTAGDMLPGAVLNAFFNRQVGRYLATSGDLTLSKGFAVLDNADDRLTIGGQWAPYAKATGYTPIVLSAGFKGNIKNSFSTVFKNGEEQNDLGVSLKASFIGKAVLRNGKEGKAATSERYRKAQSVVCMHRMTGLENARSWARTERMARECSDLDPEADDYREKGEKLVAEQAGAAAKTIEDKKYYRTSHAWWFGAELYMPFSPSEYYTVDSLTALTWSTNEMRALDLKTSATYLYTHSTLGTLFASLWLGYMNNNNILSQQLTTTSASSNASSSQGDTLALVQLDSKSNVGIGKYEAFETWKLGARGVWMVLPWIGVSGELEQWRGEYEPVNWKLGLPFTLKNNKGERVVNFELQWREQMKVHTLGVSVGLPFGGTLYK